MMKKMVVGCCVFALVMGTVAERYSFVGHRAQGMGGANAASVNDTSAQWHNPAAFGFFNRDADEVPGLQTNVISNLVVEVEQVTVSNQVPSAASGSGTNSVTAIDTPVDYSLMTVNVTNSYYTYTNEVVEAMVVPDRARADNMELEENDWGWNMLGIGAGYTMTEDMPEYVTALAEIDFDLFDGGGWTVFRQSCRNRWIHCFS
ncbi:hypothetical protein EGM51_02945 [Verrucomicrobia bacterium S94]|nr:hypothetical protein EGM51_02945 [Verrucomicrobia bacterium S94]